jgi:hypothetical protein
MSVPKIIQLRQREDLRIMDFDGSGRGLIDAFFSLNWGKHETLM